MSSIVTPNLQNLLQNLTYAYDLAGNVTSITDGINSSRTQTFTYDHLNRLSSATSTGYGTLDYAYNEIGNMTLNDRVGSYTYPQGIVGQPYGPAHPHAVSQAGGVTYNYDYNGNLTSGNGRTITWHYDNKPRTITAGSTTVTYVYDYAGQRAKKTVGSTTTRYIGKLYECTGSTCTTYIFAGNTRIAKKVGTTLTYYHQDHLGSTAAMSDASGASAGDYAYYPYGETLYASGTEKYRFTDQELDNEHGLYNYNAREYDPVLGRFISPDSIVQDFSDPQTLNRYSYCRNNPLVYVDPSGHWWEIIVGAILGGLSAGVQSDWDVEATFFGVVTGAVAGWAGGAVGGYVGSALASSVESGAMSAATAGAISGAAGGAAAGAVAGGLNAAYYGGNIGKSMLMGAGIGAVICGVMGAIGSAMGDSPGLSEIHEIQYQKAYFDGLTVDGSMLQGLTDPDPNAFSVCMRYLESKGGETVGNVFGKFHQYLWDGPLSEGWGLAPKNGFGFFRDYITGRFVPGWIQPETDWGLGCRFITNDPSRMAHIRGLIAVDRITFQWYNYPARDCYWWVDDKLSQSMSIPRGL